MTKAMTDRDLLVQKAGHLVSRAIRKGDLPHFSAFKCADCDKPAECYDHRDYTKPLDVDPVCRGCNNRRGPGWPFPAEGDHAAKKHGLGKDTGIRWNGLECDAEGYEPLSAHLNGISATDLESVLTSNEADAKLDAGMRELAYIERRKGTTTFHNGTRRGLRQASGLARAEWFKKKDPWYA